MKLKIGRIYLLTAILILLSGLLITYSHTTQKKVEYYDVLLSSAQRMERAETAVKDYCLNNGIELEAEDLNSTFLIGPYISELMTTNATDDVKRTTANPNNAALMAKYYIQAGLKKGDTIGIGLSGSFPGFAIAALCAAEELGLKVKVIASYGSSMYGATRPELNIVTILKILKDNSIADFDLVAVSPGGSKDSGTGAFDGFLYENTRELVLKLAASANAPLIDTRDISENIRIRMSYYGEIDCFVNIGGAGVNSGTGSHTLDFPSGLVMNYTGPKDTEDRGLIFEYAAKNIPVINILNIKGISTDNGLPVDPTPLPKAGEGGVYYETGYPVAVILISLVAAIAEIVIGIRKKAKSE